MYEIERYTRFYYSLTCEEKNEGKSVEGMDKRYLINAFKKMLKIETHENNIKWVNHNLKELEEEIIRRLN